MLDKEINKKDYRIKEKETYRTDEFCLQLLIQLEDVNDVDAKIKIRNISKTETKQLQEDKELTYRSEELGL